MLDTTTQLPNDTRLEDFMAEVRQFGRDAAEGKDALPKLAMGFARAVADNVIDASKDKDGHDAAARTFLEYCKSEGKKAVHNRTPESLKANISKLRQIQNAAIPSSTSSMCSTAPSSSAVSFRTMSRT
jgi:hypothetical protein